MSHDQKPGRMRVVASAGAQPTRRHDDQDPSDVPTSEEGLEAVAAEATNTGRKGSVLLALLFIAGCAIGGTMLPLLRVI